MLAVLLKSSVRLLTVFNAQNRDLHGFCHCTDGTFDNRGVVCRIHSTAGIFVIMVLLGAGWAVPYYIPLPAYNLRKGGQYSAVLEGACCVSHALAALIVTQHLSAC